MNIVFIHTPEYRYEVTLSPSNPKPSDSKKGFPLSQSSPDPTFISLFLNAIGEAAQKTARRFSALPGHFLPHERIIESVKFAWFLFVLESGAFLFKNLYFVAYEILMLFPYFIGTVISSLTTGEKESNYFNNYFISKMDRSLNLDHLTASSVEKIDIPESVTITSLTEWFDKINLTNRREARFFPGYSPYKYIQEKKVPPEDLRKSLQEMIEQIINRTLYIASPKEPEKLESYYYYQENCLRCCIYSFLNKEAAYLAIPDPSEEEKKEYDDLCNNRDRFVLDLSEASFFCAARRFMEIQQKFHEIYGMSAPFAPKGEDPVGVETSIREDLINLLQKKRESLLEKIVSQEKSTHIRAVVIQLLGPLFGFSGGEEMVDSIETIQIVDRLGIDPPFYSPNFKEKIFSIGEKFCEQYNLCFILSSLQELVKNSPNFREKYREKLYFEATESGWRQSFYQNRLEELLPEIQNLFALNTDRKNLQRLLQQKELGIDIETIDRIIKKEVSVREVIEGVVERERKYEFFDLLESETRETHGGGADYLGIIQKKGLSYRESLRQLVLNGIVDRSYIDFELE